MGQQQLFTVILVTIIIAVATVFAINAMQESYQNANREAMQEEMLMIANEAQAHYFRSQMMGGGSHSFANFTLDGTITGSQTENGTYTVTVSNQLLTIEGQGRNGEVYVKAEVTPGSDGKFNVSWSFVQS